MTEHQKNETPSQPLLYKVQPQQSEQVFSHRKQEIQEEPMEEVQTPVKDEKMEKIKREFGVYEVFEEIEREKALVEEWTKEYRKPEIAHEGMIQVKTETPIQEPTEKPIQKPVQEKPVIPKKKKKKQESTVQVITRLANSRGKSKAICEAILFGEKTQFQVIGIRKDVVKIRIGNRVRMIQLSDIKQLKVISE